MNDQIKTEQANEVNISPSGLVNRLYDGRWDAYYDPNTDEWFENKCSDMSCDYCANRPDKHGA